MKLILCRQNYPAFIPRLRQSNEFRQSHIPSRFIFAFLFLKHIQMKISRAAAATTTTVGTTMVMVVCDDLLFSVK